MNAEAPNQVDFLHQLVGNENMSNLNTRVYENTMLYAPYNSELYQTAKGIWLWSACMKG